MKKSILFTFDGSLYDSYKAKIVSLYNLDIHSLVFDQVSWKFMSIQVLAFKCLWQLYTEVPDWEAIQMSFKRSTDTKKTEVHSDKECSSVKKIKESFSHKKVKRFLIKTAKSKKSILKGTYWIILLNDTFKRSTMNKTKISSSQESRRLAWRSSVDFKGLETSLGYRYNSLVSIFFIIWMKKQWWMLCDLKYLLKSIKHTAQFIFY